MKVQIRKNGLIIVSETDFEEEYLRRYSSQGLNKACDMALISAN